MHISIQTEVQYSKYQDKIYAIYYGPLLKFFNKRKLCNLKIKQFRGLQKISTYMYMYYLS